MYSYLVLSGMLEARSAEPYHSSCRISFLLPTSLCDLRLWSILPVTVGPTHHDCVRLFHRSPLVQRWPSPLQGFENYLTGLSEGIDIHSPCTYEDLQICGPLPCLIIVLIGRSREGVCVVLVVAGLIWLKALVWLITQDALAARFEPIYASFSLRALCICFAPYSEVCSAWCMQLGSATRLFIILLALLPSRGSFPFTCYNKLNHSRYVLAIELPTRVHTVILINIPCLVSMSMAM